MRRRSFDATSGLDLFLDAICNTFGGIVFISMLVVILINATGVSSIEVKQKTLPQNQRRFWRLSQEKAQLLEMIQKQEESAKILGDPSETTELLAKAKVERNIAAHLEKELVDLKKELARIQAEISQAASDKTRYEDQKKRLESLQQQLRQEISKRTKQLAIPIEASTSLVEQAFFLSEGHLIECNDEIIKKVSVGIAPGSGEGISVSEASIADLQNQFAAYSPQQHFIAIILWEDSFSHWPTVQKALRKSGFSYRLLLLQKGEKVAPGESTGKVQQ